MREKEAIKRSYITIGYYCSLGVIVVSALLLLPLLFLPFLPSELKNAHMFLKPWFYSSLVGLVGYLLLRNREKMVVSLTHASVIVVFIWLWASLLAAVPFAIHGPYTYLHGIFESISGWTTSGLTVVDVEKASRLLLLWRSIMQYLGGAGLAVIMLTIISGPSASGVYQSEGHLDEIRPQVKQAVAMVMKIYLIYLVAGTIALMFVGMNWFDAVNHCMTALGTGGFSTYNTNVSHFDSVPIEFVLIILMLLGNTNFATHNQLFQGHWKVYLRNVEVRTSFVIMLIFIPLTLFFGTIPTFAGSYDGFLNFSDMGAWWLKFGKAIRTGIFDPISALTGTGFNSVASYAQGPAWNMAGLFLLAILMSLGGHTNSTAGGFKQLRIYMMYKSIVWYIQEQFIPKSAVTRRYMYKYENKAFIKPEHIRETFNYIAVYILMLGIGSFILMCYGYSMHGSFFEASSALGTVGLSYGITSFDAPRGVLITEFVLMFMGRLEFFVIFFSIVKIIRDIQAYSTPDKVMTLTETKS